MPGPIPSPGLTFKQSAASGPIPISISSLSLPSGMRLLPSGAGAFERTIQKHKLSRDAAQELLDIHADAVKQGATEGDRARADYYTSQQKKFLAQHGAGERVELAKKMLEAYRQARGAQAHNEALSALNRDAAHHGSVIDLLAFAYQSAGKHVNSTTGKYGGRAMSKGARRYGRGAVARVIELVKSWLRPPLPAFANSRQETVSQ